jgi:hypothetical protein
MEKTIKELRSKIGVYNKTIRNFIETNNYYFSEIGFKMNEFKLTDSDKLNNIVYDFLISKKNEIIEYENDYYKWKTIQGISDKMDLNPKDILEYFNREELSAAIKNGKVKLNNVETEIGHIIFGFFKGFDNNNDFIMEKVPELYSLYVEKELFKLETELRFISSYQIRMEIIKWKNN